MTHASKKTLFLCGSPHGGDSESLVAAKYLSHFLDHGFEFVDVCAKNLSFDAAEREEGFLDVARKMEQADCVVWVFGAMCWHPPVQLKLLYDKLFQQDMLFEGKIAATVLTGAHHHDDDILENVRCISEQLGFGYMGDVSAEGGPGGYVDHAETEDSCRVLARMLNMALARGYVPSRERAYLPREDLKPLHFGQEVAVSGQGRPKTGSKSILVISGYTLDNNPAARSVYAAIVAYSANAVHLVEIEGSGLGPCQLQRDCLFRDDCTCQQQDAFQAIKQKLHDADGVVYLGSCASGFIDAHLLTLIGRTGSMLMMPELAGKYGFAVAMGGGALGKSAAVYLDKILNGYGIHSIAAMTDGDASPGLSEETLRWTIGQLDLALEEKWKIADRYTKKAEHYIMREMAAKYGLVARGYYQFYRKNKLFDFPLLFLTRLLVPLTRSRGLRAFLLGQAAKATRASREKRLRQEMVRLGRA